MKESYLEFLGDTEILMLKNIFKNFLKHLDYCVSSVTILKYSSLNHVTRRIVVNMYVNVPFVLRVN